MGVVTAELDSVRGLRATCIRRLERHLGEEAPVVERSLVFLGIVPRHYEVVRFQQVEGEFRGHNGVHGCVLCKVVRIDIGYLDNHS